MTPKYLQHMEAASTSKKRSLTEPDDKFAIVWLKSWADIEPVCFAASHKDAHKKVEALNEELAAFIDAGGDLRGDEDSIEYFYTTSDGKRWKYTTDGEPPTPLLYVGGSENCLKDHYTTKADKVGKQVTFDVKKHLYFIDLTTKKRRRCIFIAEQDNASMAAAVELSAVDENDDLVRNFWHNIRLMEPLQIETLRSIYEMGDYAEIPQSPHDADSEEEDYDDRVSSDQEEEESDDNIKGRHTQ